MSTVSAYLNCPEDISFALPAIDGSCSSGNYTSVYQGIAQEVATTQNSIFYLASATGGVKVTFLLIDLGTGKLIIKGVGYGSISGGTCQSPSIILPVYVNFTTNVISPGDNLELGVNTTFTGTGLPTFCSGPTTPTVVSFGTTVVGVSSQPVLTTLLVAGTPSQATLLGYEGITEPFNYGGNGSVTAIVLGIVKDSAGSTVGVLSGSVTVSSGVQVTAFLPFKGLPSGSYTVTVIAISSQDIPVSTVQIVGASV